MYGMKKTSIIILVLIIFGIIFFLANKKDAIVVTNFEECIAAGNSVMESYPRQCRDGDSTFIEEIEPAQKKDIPTSADNAPPGSIHNLPVPDAVAAVRALVAEELGIGEGVVIILSAFEKEWPNSCLGLAGEGEFCAQVITPGYEVTVQAEGSQSVYRTNADGTLIRMEL